MDEKTKPELLTGTTPAIGQASRLSGTSAIQEAILRLRRRADELETFLNSLPRTLPIAADEALWRLVIESKFS